MTAARKAFASVIHFFGVDVWGAQLQTGAPSQTPEGDDQHRIGEYYADYSLPTPEELHAHDPELEKLLKNSKPVSR